MGSKGEEFFGMLELGKSYMLKNGFVIALNSKESLPDILYNFVPLEKIENINAGQIIDTFGYVCDMGSMTVDVHHESFADNMMVNMTVGCTNDTRLLISGMGYRRGVWFARSGIQEDSIVAIKGIRIERQVNELLLEAGAILRMKQGVDGEDDDKAADGEESTKLAKFSKLKEFVSVVVKDIDQVV
ncbi:hypothetical protein DAPPUDRAFT_333798 [Daphnia pulex]|uniref:Uncharacterized protein n=1 Tax=Daphnia pulex TaxID=6669 RepID=E9HTV3_DAPPU|nr:hypothetical protein DAPPUDRAFT_333798 [Daphnia pulex]|eukprot:EFX64829.1 hypothetical protein DAPPUDRAFT_333798 [Daphnia pulex]